MGPALQLEGGSCHSVSTRFKGEQSESPESKMRDCASKAKTRETGGVRGAYPSEVGEFFIDSFESHVLYMYGRTSVTVRERRLEAS
jgi:hypothetical protein